MARYFISTLFALFYSSIVYSQCFCPQPAFNETYDSLSNWSVLDNTAGQIILSGTQLFFDGPAGADYNRIFRQVPGLPAISTHFTARCTFKPIDGNSPGHFIMAFTQNSDDPSVYNLPGYPPTHNNVFGATFLSPLTPHSHNCCLNPTDPSNPWGFHLYVKNDSVLNQTLHNQYIPVGNMNQFYYIELQRWSASEVSLSVFSDSLFTQHIPGSPICGRLDESFGNLSYLQQGVITIASWYRHIRALIDDVQICGGVHCNPCSTTGEIPVSEIKQKIRTTSANGELTIYNSDGTEIKLNSVEIINLAGKVVLEKNNVSGDRIVFKTDFLSDGIYILNGYSEDKNLQVKFIVDNSQQ